MRGSSEKLWEASRERQDKSHMAAFARFVSQGGAQGLASWQELYRWSIAEPGRFWAELARFTAVEWQTPYEYPYDPPPPGRMLGARWFPGGQLSYAANLLLPASTQPSRPALIALNEEGSRRVFTGAQLLEQVGIFAAALQKLGVGEGDRVAGVLRNGWEALVAMLATSARGGVWSSCSPDFGAAGIVDRFAQIEAKVLFFSTGYQYGGKTFDCTRVIAECLAKLPRKPVVVQVGPESQAGASSVEGLRLSDFISLGEGASPLRFAARAFDDPLFIVFSSGTTGLPKAIVHGVGGTLLQHKKELMLHSDVGAGDRFLYYTTCGWMMWNWMASALATGACLVTYDGSPAYPDLEALWRIAGAEELTVLGTSPKYMGACLGAGLRPREQLPLPQLRTLLSTGSPLLPEHFAWVYEHVQPDIHLASISGGTDILSCFMLGNPLLPVYSGQIQGPGLGIALDCYDDEGHAVQAGKKGELVCTAPFVAMPLGFLDDPHGKRYQKTYFEHYPNTEVWRHGDYIAFSPEGGITVYGRSDATLNPGGVRIGTSEIYRQVEGLAAVDDSLAVGRSVEGDCEVVLFVKLRPGHCLTSELKTKIKDLIRSRLTPRHVPTVIAEVSAIPYTRSGKKVEMAVAKILRGDRVDNAAALANPEALLEFERFAALKP